MKKTHNNLKHFICHHFADQAWNDPDLASSIYVHVDLSKQPDNDKLNESSIVTWLEDHSWKDPLKTFIGIGHYRRQLDLSKIDALDSKKAYIHNEPQPAPPRQIWHAYHSKEYLDEFLEQLKLADCKTYEAFNRWLDDPKTTAFCPTRSLMILPKKSFCDWMAFAKRMMAIAMLTADKTKHLDIWQDRYQKRQPGFMMERLTSFWLSECSGLQLEDTPMIDKHIFSPVQRMFRSCVVAIQKDETNLDEWAKWHLDVCGFWKIVLFNDGCREHIFPPSIHERVVQMPALHSKELPAQFTCYNYFLHMMSKDFDAALFIDLDEYLNLHGKTIEEHIWATGQCITRSFNWVYFGSKVVGDFPKDSLAKRFKYRSFTPDKHVKMLLDLRLYRLNQHLKMAFINPHSIWTCEYKTHMPSLNGSGQEMPGGPYFETKFDINTTPYIAHYYCKTKEEFQKKIARGRADCFEDSDQQYYRQEEHMWDEFDKCDRNDIYDDEIARALQ